MHDVAVVGAGPVGATFACALAGSGLDLMVLDARARGEIARGDRSLALSHGARLILERVGVFGALAATPGAVTPITAIDVSQARGFGSVRLAAVDVGLPALGYVVSYRALQAALDARLAALGVPVRHGAAVGRVRASSQCASIEADGQVLEARLAVVADGSGDQVEGIARARRDYGQVAVVCDVRRDTPQDGTAYERFTAEGPVALLPKGEGYGLVWTMSPADAQGALAQDDAAFLAALSRHAGARLGRIVSAGARRSFPLALEYAKPAALPRIVLLGNAAQTLHPIAGQGFNIGLRDAFECAGVVADTPRETIGGHAMVARYLARRRGDRGAGIAFTHALTRLFGSGHPALAWPRGAGLAALDSLPAVKRAFTRGMLFGFR